MNYDDSYKYMCQVCGYWTDDDRQLSWCGRGLKHLTPNGPGPWRSVKMVFFEVWK